MSRRRARSPSSDEEDGKEVSLVLDILGGLSWMCYVSVFGCMRLNMSDNQTYLAAGDRQQRQDLMFD